MPEGLQQTRYNLFMADDFKLPVVDPMASPVNTGSSLVNTPPQSKVIERKVYIKTVKDIAEYDYPQAARTWAAFEAVGIDPSELVANALEEGHGYKSDTIAVNSPFVEKDIDSLLGESLSGGEKLVSYKYVDEKKLLDVPGGQDGMEIVVQSREVATIEEDNRPRAVKLIAILRKKLPTLLK